jgi:hypothetical protein
MPRPFFRKAFEHWLAGNRARFAHPPRITERRKGHLTLVFQGITPKITCSINKTGVCIAVEHEGECVDLIANFDIAPRRDGAGHYFCAMCPEPEYFDSRRALWEGHCFEPLLEWVNRELRAEQWLHIHIHEGFSWAMLQPEGITAQGNAPQNEEGYEGAWPVVP